MVLIHAAYYNAHTKELKVTKKYNIIYADPPWNVKAGPDWGSSGPSKPLPYPTMSIDEIKALAVKVIADKNAHLYLWTINKYIAESYEVAKAWGFKPSCMLTWVKPPHGIGIGGTYVQNMFREMVVEVSGDLPRVELFCRDPHEGWDVWGNEVECTAELSSAV